MKRAKTKFARKLEGGGNLIDWLGKDASTKINAKQIGAGFDVLGNTFGSGGNRGIDFGHTNPWSVDAAENYNKTIARNQATKQKVSSGLSTAGDLAMLEPGIGTAIGLGLKGLGMAAKFIPFGKGKEKEAKTNFDRLNEFGKNYQQQLAGVQSFNRMPKYQAPAYGKKGMKFKTKFSKK